jgi:hypothetical protein
MEDGFIFTFSLVRLPLNDERLVRYAMECLPGSAVG